jgi:hypothetical protein
MSKKTIYVVIAIVSAILFGIIWDHCNVESGLDEIKATTGKLFGAPMIGNKTTDPAAKLIIDSLNNAIAGHKYTVARPALKPAFDNFIKDWAGAGALTKKIQDDHRVLLDAQYESKGHMEWNQLIALFLDWLIWMLALGLCLFSDILRDVVGDGSKLQGQALANAAVGNTDPVDPPYSLARTQLVIWITIIGSVYTFAVLWDGRDPLVINNTALILMGISAGTFAVGAIVDTTEIQQGIPRIQDQPSTNNFLRDILSDSKGVSVHRFQNLVWTIIAIVIYFYRYNNPPSGTTDVLPVLDSTLLALTGISSATYLTMKTRENPTPPEVVDQLKIKLGLSPATSAKLSPAVLNALATGGFPNAVISIVDKGSNTIHPVPDPAAPSFNFNAVNIAAGAYTIKADWSGSVPAGTPPPPSTVLTTTWNGQIDKTTPSPVNIDF